MNKQEIFSKQAAKFLKGFIKPYHRYGLCNIMHDVTYGKSQISMLVTQPEITTFYKQHKIPMLCTDESGRTLAPGLYLNKALEKKHKDCSILMPLLIKVGREFGQNYGKNSLHFVRVESDCQHLYSLFFDLEENEFLQWVINNGDFLSNLTANYTIASRDISLEANENRITLPNFSANSSIIDKDTYNIGIIHYRTNIPIHLSKQQSSCIFFLMQGKSAKEIAIQMKLSHRTVEHYLKRIRDLLGCTTNKELLLNYYQQFIYLANDNH